MTPVVLKPPDTTEGRAVLFFVGVEPPCIVGELTEGIRLSCGRCAAQLATGLPSNAIAGVVLECPICGELNEIPPVGSRIPIPKSIRLGAQRYRFLERLHVHGTAALVGPPYASVEKPSHVVEFHPALGLQLLKDLLGDVYAKIYATARKTLRQARRPSHALGRAIVGAQRLPVDGLTTNTYRALCEVAFAYHAIAAWKQHPDWQVMVPALGNAHEYWHNVIHFAFAKALSDSGNHVELLPSNRQGRCADVRLHWSPTLTCWLEIKTPECLRSDGMKNYHPEEVVKTALHDAGTSLGSQLPPTSSGILTVAGVSLGASEISDLEVAAKRVLGARAASHIAGIFVFNVTFPALVDGNEDVFASHEVRFAANPHYKGDVRFSSF